MNVYIIQVSLFDDILIIRPAPVYQNILNDYFWSRFRYFWLDKYQVLHYDYSQTLKSC